MLYCQCCFCFCFTTFSSSAVQQGYFFSVRTYFFNDVNFWIFRWVSRYSSARKICGSRNTSTIPPSISTGKKEATLRIFFAFITSSLFLVSYINLRNCVEIFYLKSLTVGLVIFLGVLGLYYAAYRTRKKMNLAKRLGEEPRTRWETFCHKFELGQDQCSEIAGVWQDCSFFFKIAGNWD